jgi:hypothetical protein
LSVAAALLSRSGLDAPGTAGPGSASDKELKASHW